MTSFKHTSSLKQMMCAMAVLCFALAPSLDASAKPPKHKGKHGAHHKLRRHLYSPEMIVKHADELKLSDAQGKKIRTAMKKASNTKIDLRFELQKESSALVKMVKAQTVYKAKTLAQADKVMLLESKLKRNTLELMLTVKSILTSEQIAKIEEFRKKKRQHHKGRHMKKRRRGPF